MSYPAPGMVGPRAIARWALGTMSDGVAVSGLERVPTYGPVLLVARHYHHLLDAAVLVRHLRRPLHIVVGLDWAADTRVRRWMERLCRWAWYPVILRPATTGERAGYDRNEIGRYLRTGLRDAATLLRDGRLVLVFPEGYPLVDPGPPRTLAQRDADGFLPFASGFRTILALARHAGAPPTALVPVGFHYERRGEKWRITTRIGAPLRDGATVAETEHAVHTLSKRP